MNSLLSSPDPAYLSLTIKEIREQVRNFKTFTLIPDRPLNYQPGQFITLVDLHKGQEIRRSYSIISSPALDEPLTIAVKRIENGYFSRKLVDDSLVGDKLLTTGAAGFFQLPENMHNYDSVFFFAAGSGIAPVFSLIKTILVLYPAIRVQLVYSNSNRETTAFFTDLRNLELNYPKQLHIHFLNSSDANLRRARLNQDLLLELLSIRKSEGEKSLFYTCGPENYMRMIIFHLIEEGFPKENIKKEDFNPGNRKIAGHMPPDKNTYQIQLQFRGVHYSFPVIYPDSILRAAQKRKINLPYSCETGKCGSCVARCISGDVWLSNNEVLTEKELSQGLTLTCTGHPQHGEVNLKID